MCRRLVIRSHVQAFSHCEPCAGVKSYEHAQGAAGALGWRLSADQVSALDQASDDLQIATGLPFENW